MRRPEPFDANYYDPRTRVASSQETGRLADHVSAALLHFEVPVRRILDVGCGLDLWCEGLLRAFPKASYTGLEISEHLARTARSPEKRTQWVVLRSRRE